MADAVTTRVIGQSKSRYAVHLTGVSDGTGESGVLKVDKSTLVAGDNAEPASLDIEQIWWAIQGHLTIRFLWDHSTDDTALVLPAGIGYLDFRCGYGDLGSDLTGGTGLADPRSSGGSGDILLTSSATSGATYDITLFLLKNTD